MSMADNIKALREYSNMTQDDFAKQVAGVSFQAVSTWERGEREPRMGIIQKLSDYYQIPKSLLIDGTPAELLSFLRTHNHPSPIADQFKTAYDKLTPEKQQLVDQMIQAMLDKP